MNNLATIIISSPLLFPLILFIISGLLVVFNMENSFWAFLGLAGLLYFGARGLACTD